MPDDGCFFPAVIDENITIFSDREPTGTPRRRKPT
jgi:hypothetical protein